MKTNQLRDHIRQQLRESQHFVIMMHRLNSWYYQALKDTHIVTGVIWTPYISMAHIFSDERSVEEFKMTFISPRNVQILRLKQV